MNMYGKGPQQQAMQTLIHDTNRDLFNVAVYAKKLRAALLKLQVEGADTKEATALVGWIENRAKGLQDSLDNYYKAFQTFPSPVETDLQP